MERLSDEALLAMLLDARAHAAFSVLVRRHAERFRRVAFRFIGTREEAEDIVQECFVKLWDRPQLWNAGGGAKFTTWFYRVVVNRCHDVRKTRRTVPIAEGVEFADTRDLQDAQLDKLQKARAMEAAFRTLPENMQTSLNLSFYEDLPNKESAEIMGLSLKAFQSLLMRSKDALKQAVGHYTTDKVRNYGSR